MSEKARDINVTGCLAKSADGRYMLTNARVDDAASDRSSTTSTTSSTTTAGTSGTTATAGATASGGTNAATNWMLMGDSSDLDKHVGHKIQVTGRSMSGAMDHDRSSSTATPPATGTTSGTTAGTTGSTAGTASGKADQPQLNVQSVKMISSSCS